jgi:topoisomerase-4 subunit A
LRKLKFEIDFSGLAIKGRGAGGNKVTKYPISKIELKEEGVSTLSARKIWYDDTVQRLNSDGRGEFLGDFKAEDKILTITQSGHYKLTGFDLSTKFDEDMIVIEKWNPKKPVTAVYFDGEKEQFFVKRFLVEPTDKKVLFITEHPKSYLEIVSTDWKPQIKINFSKQKGKERDPEIVDLESFISIKGLKAIGNRLTPHKVKNIDLLEPLPYEEPKEEDENSDSENENEMISNEKQVGKPINQSDDIKINKENLSNPAEENAKVIIKKNSPIKKVDNEDNQMTLF